jgi:hypothetical protein
MFMDVWSIFEDDLVESIPILLDANCENDVVCRSQGMSARLRQELYVEEGEIPFSRVLKSMSSQERLIII